MCFLSTAWVNLNGTNDDIFNNIMLLVGVRNVAIWWDAWWMDLVLDDDEAPLTMSLPALYGRGASGEDIRILREGHEKLEEAMDFDEDFGEQMDIGEE